MNINLTLIGQMITFTIFVIFTMRFIWPPLEQSMRNRKVRIAEGLSFTERAEKELQTAKNNAFTIIQQAKIQAKKIIDHANMRAAEIDKQAKENAVNDVNRIRQSMNNEVIVQKQMIKQQLRKEVVAIAVSIAEKLIQYNINTRSHSKFLEQIVSELQ